MSLNHIHQLKSKKKGVLLSALLNIIFAVLELIVGFFANSLALVTDAIHDFSDAMALMVSYIGIKYAEKAPTSRKTFGFQKVQILTAFINAFFLAILTFFVLWKIIPRIFHPKQVRSLYMIYLAILGIFVNGIAVFILNRNKGSLNIKAAILHLLEDFFGWIAVLIGGAIIYFTNWYIIDSILSILIAIFVSFGVYKILKESIDVLIDSVPSKINLKDVKTFVLNFSKDIKSLHDIHIWTLGDNSIALMSHIQVKDKKISDYCRLLACLERKLKEKFQITHVTIELESGVCKSEVDMCN